MGESYENQEQTSLKEKILHRSYDSTVNVSQTENSGNQIVNKRPSGRPKMVRKSLGMSESTISDYHVKTKNLDKSYEKDDSLLTTPTVKRARGRPKLSKSLVGCSGSESRGLTDFVKKRGKGRPKGSLNKKRALSLDENFIANAKKARTDQNLSNASLIEKDLPSISNGNNLLNQSEDRENSMPIVGQKRGRGRPQGAKNRSKMTKLNATDGKSPKRRKSKQIKIDEVIRYIPKERFEEAMEMFNNDDHSIWQEKNGSCNKSIHRYWDEYLNTPSNHNMRLKFARQFLLRRDWVNLSKVLSISLQDYRTSDNSYFSLYTKYAAICLAHTDKQHFNKFLQFLLKTETDVEMVLQKCTKVTTNLPDGE